MNPNEKLPYNIYLEKDSTRFKRYILVDNYDRRGLIISKIIVNQSRKYKINPTFVVAVAGKESSFGAASCSSNPKNVWGLGACNRAWRTPEFKSWIQAINYFVRFIDGRWPSANNPFEFYGYCQGCEYEWGSAVSTHMRNITGSTRVR